MEQKGHVFRTHHDSHHAEDVEKSTALTRRGGAAIRIVFIRIVRSSFLELRRERARRRQNVFAVHLNAPFFDSLHEIPIRVVRKPVQHGRQVDSGKVPVVQGGVYKNAKVGIHGEVREPH